MPSAPGAPPLALTRLNARPRFSGESIRSHSEISRPGMTASSGRAAGRYAQLRDSTELTVSSRQLARVRGMAAITATSTSNTDSSVSPDVRPFPAPYLIPAGTTTSADFCPVNPHLTMRAAGAATPQHNQHPGRPPRIRTTTFPLRPPRLRDNPVGDDGLYLLEQAHPDRLASYAVRVPRCRVSPRASFPPRLTTTQLPPARSSTTSSSRDLHPQAIAHAGRTQGGACGAAGPASAPGSAVERPARRTPGHTPKAAQIKRDS